MRSWIDEIYFVGKRVVQETIQKADLQRMG